MTRSLYLIFVLFLCSCNQKNTGDGGRPGDEGPVEPGKPVPLAKVVSVSLGTSHACAVDDQNHVACWAHPQKFIPSSPGSTRGSYEVDYPQKTNADVAGKQFTAFAAFDNIVCALRHDGKVLCFIPTDPSEKKQPDLATMGPFTQVVVTGNGRFCALDPTGGMSCHIINFGGVTRTVGLTYIDDYTSLDEITSFSVGTIQEGASYGAGVCWITDKGSLACAWARNSPTAPPLKEEAYSITGSSTLFFQYLAMVSLDKKTLKVFGPDRQITIKEMDPLKLDQHYKDLALAFSGVCTILTPSNEISCQREKDWKNPKRSNEDLKSEQVTKVSVGHNLMCGLRPDKTAFCWQPEGYQPEVPKNIRAD